MAAFYTCSDCDKEFLGPDAIPVQEGDHVKPVCWKCQEMYDFCIVCDAMFQPDPNNSDPMGDLCTDCWRSDGIENVGSVAGR